MLYNDIKIIEDLFSVYESGKFNIQNKSNIPVMTE